LTKLKVCVLSVNSRMEKIRDSKAPQVLKIAHDEADDAVSLSGDSEVESDEELTPLRDSDSETIHRVYGENAPLNGQHSPQILPSGTCEPCMKTIYLYW